MALESYDSFEAVKTRLDEIVDAVSDDELALDDALALYEEAVGPTMCPHRRRVRRFRRSPW